MSRSTNTIGFLKTTAIGGLLFLLPLIVVIALIGQVVPIVLTIAGVLGDVIPVRTAGGIALLILLAIAILLLVCFGAGLLARWSLGKRVSASFEKTLLVVFPRYAILKDRMAGTIGGDETKPAMTPVLATLVDSQRIGFEIERTDKGLVTVYLPGSPDPWSGSVVLLDAERVDRVEGDFASVVATFERLGRGSASLLAGNAAKSMQETPSSRDVSAEVRELD